MTNPHTPVLTEQEQLAHGCSGKSSCGSGFGVHKVQLCSGGAYGSLSRGVSLPSCGKSVPLQCTRRHFHAGWRLEQKDLSQENQYVQSCSEGFLNIKEHNKVLLFSGQLFKPWRKQQYWVFLFVYSDPHWWETKNTPSPPSQCAWVEGQVKFPLLPNMAYYHRTEHTQPLYLNNCSIENCCSHCLATSIHLTAFFQANDL